MEGNKLRLREVLSQTISMFGLRNMEDLPVQDMQLWAVQALGQIGSSDSFETIVAPITISEYRGVYPKDMYYMERIKGYPKIREHRSYFEIGLREGTVEMVYYKLATDEEGCPLFPDNVPMVTAISWYIAKWLSLRGILPNKQLSPDYCDSEWQWYCGQARAEGFTPTMQQTEMMNNVFHRFTPRFNEYDAEFEGLAQSNDYSERDSQNNGLHTL